MGDFNIHLNNLNDGNAQVFAELMDSLGLTQHVKSATHKAGNILDHFYTETAGKIDVTQCVNRDFISDHCIVHTVLDVPKEDFQQKTLTYRKLSSVNRAAFADDMQFDYAGIDDPNTLIQKFENQARVAINKHAPEKTRTLIIRPKNSWFTPEVRQQRIVVRKTERLWKRKKTSVEWDKLKEEKIKYRNLLWKTKSAVLNSQIMECKGNTKKLYQVFDNITGKKRDNPFPEGQTDQDLADNFANYFLGKIQAIRDALQSVPAYSPTS